ncbi:MAG: permease [Candidatus Bathyarchaeota archaeon B26-2]|nr:MAG: permease [Candidatus Bathyarchaeota archaeon B26-2]
MLGEFLAVLTALLWAVSTILSARALRDMNPIRANMLRTLFSALTMPFISLALGEFNEISNIDPVSLLFVIVAAIIGFGLGDTFLFKSMTMIGVSRSYTIAYTYPLFTILIAVPTLRESLLPTHLLGAVAITLGVILVTSGESGDREGEAKNVNLWGVLAALANALLWAVGTVLVAVGLREMSATLANTLRFPLLFLFLLVLSKPKGKWNLNHKSLAAIALSGLLGMVIGGITFLLSVQMIGASRATALSATSPLWASIMSSLLLRERVTARLLSASTLVVLGVYVLTA